ncbi:MAG: hypothetical protein EKK62_16790 [Acidimicrobiia bacterium]|nr:MAG: hypothetical protein EKK62_16790 [Acidimicrobiia bacterium]
MVIPAMVSASTDQRLRGAPLGVYVWLVCHRLDLQEYRALKIDGLAVSLRVKRHTASRALHLLVDGGYIERRGVPQTGYEYRLRYTRAA